MLLIQTILLMPFLISLFWTFLIFSRKGGTGQLRSMGLLMLVVSVCFYADAVLSFPDSGAGVSLVADILYHAFACVALPCCFLYIRSISGHSTGKLSLAAMFLPVALFAGTSIALYAIMGKDALEFLEASARSRSYSSPVFEGSAYRLHYIICVQAFRWTLLAEMALLAAYLLTLLRRNHFAIDDMSVGQWTHESQVTSIYVSIGFLISICAFKVAFGRYYMMDHQSINCVLAAIISFEVFRTAYKGMGLFGFEKAESEAQRVAKITPAKEPEDELASPPVHSPHHSSKTFVPDERTTMERLRDNMERYMSSEPAPYINPNLTISDVAEALGTNRTYISVLLNQYYKQSFRDYIAEARVNAAKKMLLEHPELPLDSIADASGYLSSSQLIKKFKESEGAPPRVWLQQQKKSD